MKPLLLLFLLGCSASVFGAPAESKVRWCVKSAEEQQKCLALAKKDPVFSCVLRGNSKECIDTIVSEQADAITLDGGDIYQAGLNNYNLQPIIAEDYGTTSDTCYFAVAVVKKGSGFNIRDLRGKKSCHTGLGKSAGWNIPMGTLLSMNIMNWAGTEDKPLEEEVGTFFQSSCAPGAAEGSKLCSACKGDCSRSQKEPYYDYNGAFQCLVEDAGDVAFVKHLTVPDAEKANYELLCKDNTRAPIDDYERCHLARVPAHAVVTRKNPELAELIWNRLNSIQSPQANEEVFKLFSSDGYGGKNLMFKDSTVKLVQVPPNTDHFLYLGAEYTSIIRSLHKDQNTVTSSTAIKWCSVGHAETVKCDEWSINSASDDGTATMDCHREETVDDCVKKIMRKEADAMAVDGGQVYMAGQCGLVPVMVEQYDNDLCSSSTASASSYYAVAVVKKSSGLTWDTLRGKKSCHTGLSRTAGWNIPMGLIYDQTKECDFSKFFSGGCAPGSDPSSSFCSACAGSGKAVGDESKCKASAEEQYYGYAGAFRCLVEDAGDVAFIKHTIVPENTDYQDKRPSWVKEFKSSDFQLLCPGKGPSDITDHLNCHLAKVPAHAVVTRPDSRNDVLRILKEQQAKFGSSAAEATFKMFQSTNGKNLLFKDSTKCLQEVPEGQKYREFLGPEYMTAMNALRHCTDSTPDLEKSCSFHSCQRV